MAACEGGRGLGGCGEGPGEERMRMRSRGGVWMHTSERGKGRNMPNVILLFAHFTSFLHFQETFAQCSSGPSGPWAAISILSAASRRGSKNQYRYASRTRFAESTDDPASSMLFSVGGKGGSAHCG